MSKPVTESGRLTDLRIQSDIVPANIHSPEAQAMSATLAVKLQLVQLHRQAGDCSLMQRRLIRPIASCTSVCQSRRAIVRDYLGRDAYARSRLQDCVPAVAF